MGLYWPLHATTDWEGIELCDLQRARAQEEIWFAISGESIEQETCLSDANVNR